MVTKKRVLVTIMVIVMVVATVSAGVMGRGGFGGYGAAAVVAADETSDDVTRPVQQWQTLTEEELANCPLYAEGVDVEAIRAFQAERAELREEAQIGAGYGPSKNSGRSLNNSRNASNNGRRSAVANQYQPQFGGQHMMYQPNAAQATYGPAWAR